jgi:hypothetical protein
MTEGESSAGAVSYREGDTPVTLPGLSVVGVKLIGLYLVVRTISQSVAMPFYFPEFASQSVRLLLGAIMPSLIDVAIGVVLIFKAEWIVMRMRVSADKALPISPNEHFQGVAFSILGVVLMVWALADIALLLATFVQNNALQNAGNVVEEFSLGTLAHPIVFGTSGLLLFLRRRGLASLWHRMRYGGVRVREVE